jgi:hypothetical protein
MRLIDKFLEEETEWQKKLCPVKRMNFEAFFNEGFLTIKVLDDRGWHTGYLSIEGAEELLNFLSNAFSELKG